MHPLRMFVFAAAMIIPGVALAEPGHSDVACKTDLQALCAGVQPGGGRLRDCMKEHRAQISPACKIALADRMLERAGQHGGGGQNRVEHGRQSVLGDSASIKTVPSGN